MLKVTLKSILGHKSRLVSTSIAIILGVAFVAGTLVLTDTVQRAFDDLFSSINENTSAEARSSSVVETQFGDLRGRISADIIDEINEVDGVKNAVGILQASAQMVDPEGELIGTNNGPPKFGFNWIDDEDLNPWTITDGRAPEGPTEVTIDSGSALVSDIEVGETISVLTAQDPQEFEVVGIASFGSAANAGGSTAAMFDLATAQELFDADGMFNVIDMTAEDGVSQEQLVERLQANIDNPDVEFITGEQVIEDNQTAIKDAFSFFTIFLLVFAFIALFVGSFVIYNTFAIIVTQRTKEMALLRALGASRRQIRGSVFIEALVIGSIASVLGIFAGVGIAAGLKQAMASAGIGLPPGSVAVLPRTLIVGLLAGLAVTLFAALFPALKASRIPPIQALREVAVDTEGSSRSRLIIGLAVTAIGITALLIGLLQPVLELVGLGAALLFVGLLGLGPVIAPVFTRFVSYPLPKMKGIVGRLARDNSMRNPTRTSRTAAALLVGVALVSAVTVLASSLKTSIRDIFEESFVGDFAIDSGSFDPALGLSPQLTIDLNNLPEVKAATGIRLATGEVDGEPEFMTAVDPVTALQVFDIGVPEGTVASDLGVDDIFVYEEHADDLGVGVGDELTVKLTDGLHQLTISSLYSKNEVAGNFTVSHALTEATGAQQFDMQSYVLLADRETIESARPAIAAVADKYPNGELQDKEEFIVAQSASIDGLVNMIYGLLFLAVIIAVVGIANTLRLSVMERTREIGLLRAVGMTRRQIRSVIRWEAAITALLGAVQGVIVGLLLGYAVIYALRSEGLNKFSVPSFALVIIVAVAALFGVLAAIFPARRAAKMDVLEAISHD